MGRGVLTPCETRKGVVSCECRLSFGTVLVKIYLDLCCLKRPLDDQSQERVRLEAEAVKLLLERIDRGDAEGCNSEALVAENALNPVVERRSRAAHVISSFGKQVAITRAIERQAETIETMGFAGFDALHIASAAAAGAQVFLTCDDRLERRAARFVQRLPLRVVNPVEFLRSEKPRP